MKTRKAEAPDQEQDLHVHQNVAEAGSGHTERAEIYFSCKCQFPVLQSDCNPGQGDPSALSTAQQVMS